MMPEPKLLSAEELAACLTAATGAAPASGQRLSAHIAALTAKHAADIAAAERRGIERALEDAIVECSRARDACAGGGTFRGGMDSAIGLLYGLGRALSPSPEPVRGDADA